jgi:chromate transporter
MAVAAATVALVAPAAFVQVAIIAAGAAVGALLLDAPAGVVAGPEPRPVSRRLGLLAFVAFLLLLGLLPALAIVTRSPEIAQAEAYYRAGALVFGGGHLVLPLLDATVVAPGWVTESQFLAGYGAAQAVPGPLFTFAAYLGAVASVPPGGVAGATLAVGAIFLPSFLLVWAALAFWDDLRRSERVRRALAGTNAVVVGILAAALWSPLWTGSIATAADVGIVVASILALVRLRVPPVAVVGLAAVAAQAVTWASGPA